MVLKMTIIFPPEKHENWNSKSKNTIYYLCILAIVKLTFELH